MKTQKVPRIVCPDCGGTGIDNMDSSMYCPFCDGKKTVPKFRLKGTIFEEK
jgi:rubredoxin